MLVGVIGLRNLTTHINTNINMNNEHQYNHQSNQLPELINHYLGDSISGTCKKLELFLTWDRDGEWRVGAGRARSSATGTWKRAFCRFWRRPNQVRSLLSCLPTLMFMKRARSYSRFHWYTSSNLSRRVAAEISVLQEKPEVNQRR